MIYAALFIGGWSLLTVIALAAFTSPYWRHPRRSIREHDARLALYRREGHVLTMSGTSQVKALADARPGDNVDGAL